MVKENALLIGVKLPSDPINRVMSSLDELKELSITAGASVVDSIIQQRKEIDSKYYIGKGKVEEIKYFYKNEKKNDLIIFNHESTPSQIRNLEKELKMKVITRTELILDIFSLHAKSGISMLQVELALLKYQLPRITGKGTSMSRPGGGIGTRGPGEQQLELDRRLIMKKIHLIGNRLKHIELERSIQRKNRVENEFKSALIGYTNSGKSTLLNRLTKSNVQVEDQLFVTLDTTTRKLWLGFINGKSAHSVITDTVGFIQDLPHDLIESFKSTLEDTIQADLLIHIIDISTDFSYKKKVVEKTIFELGANNIPLILCFNKIDRLSEEEVLNIRLQYPEALYISAKENLNINFLKEKLKEFYILKYNNNVIKPLFS